jgi:hypothetical protein
MRSECDLKAFERTVKNLLKGFEKALQAS